MIDANTLAAVVQALAQAAPQAEQIVLFGSHARGDADAGSDLDFLVIESVVVNRAREMVRLRRALRSLRVPVDVLVYSRDEVNCWGNQPGTARHFTGPYGKGESFMAEFCKYKSIDKSIAQLLLESASPIDPEGLDRGHAVGVTAQVMAWANAQVAATSQS